MTELFECRRNLREWKSLIMLEGNWDEIDEKVYQKFKAILTNLGNPKLVEKYCSGCFPIDIKPKLLAYRKEMKGE